MLTTLRGTIRLIEDAPALGAKRPERTGRHRGPDRQRLSKAQSKAEERRPM
jgi:hypothetical protein